MKIMLLSVAALAAVIGAGVQNVAAQENPNQPNRTSIRVAGYEIVLDGGEQGGWHGWHGHHGYYTREGGVSTYRHKNHYGGRIGAQGRTSVSGGCGGQA